ncbi:30S ribosomal protein S [Marssonina coronariae]|uniref:30S ribosomal protein S n=1 Tax=Diplocarpon coronariae TaxID=2795749 RepID=A0A218Z5A6_9HELO|nr:30S ribosomal protein S [Marssonina coronariae]
MGRSGDRIGHGGPAGIWGRGSEAASGNAPAVTPYRDKEPEKKDSGMAASGEGRIAGRRYTREPAGRCSSGDADMAATTAVQAPPTGATVGSRVTAAPELDMTQVAPRLETRRYLRRAPLDFSGLQLWTSQSPRVGEFGVGQSYHLLDMPACAAPPRSRPSLPLCMQSSSAEVSCRVDTGGSALGRWSSISGVLSPQRSSKAPHDKLRERAQTRPEP